MWHNLHGCKSHLRSSREKMANTSGFWGWPMERCSDASSFLPLLLILICPFLVDLPLDGFLCGPTDSLLFPFHLFPFLDFPPTSLFLLFPPLSPLTLIFLYSPHPFSWPVLSSSSRGRHHCSLVSLPSPSWAGFIYIPAPTPRSHWEYFNLSIQLYTPGGGGGRRE